MDSNTPISEATVEQVLERLTELRLDVNDGHWSLSCVNSEGGSGDHEWFASLSDRAGHSGGIQAVGSAQYAVSAARAKLQKAAEATNARFAAAEAEFGPYFAAA